MDRQACWPSNRHARTRPLNCIVRNITLPIEGLKKRLVVDFLSEFPNLNQVKVNRNTQNVGVDSEQKYVETSGIFNLIGRVMERAELASVP